MRVDENEGEAITSSIKELDPQAKIYLFGSRTDPAKKGGDIDILILSQYLTNSDKIPLKRLIFEKIEEQKIVYEKYVKDEVTESDLPLTIAVDEFKRALNALYEKSQLYNDL